MAHIHYLQKNLKAGLEERVTKLIAWLKDNGPKDKLVRFSMKGKYNRWEELDFFPVRIEGIGVKQTKYYGNEEVVVYSTSANGMLRDDFFEDLEKYPDTLRIMVKATQICFYEKNYETGEWTLNKEQRVAGTENDSDNEEYKLHESIDDYEPEELFSMIQTYAKSTDEKLRKVYEEKLAKIILNR